MKKNILIILLLFSMSEAFFAQEQNIFTRYRYHLNIINPAYIGIDDQTILTSSLRRQWTGVPDAPELQNISFGTPLTDNLAIGTAIEHNKTFLENYGFIAVDIAYKLYLSRNTTLHFGIKAAADYYNVNLMGIKTHDISVDPALQSINSIKPNIGVGFLIKDDNWYASLSIPRIFNITKIKDKEGIAFLVDDLPQLYLGLEHDFFITDDIILKPVLNWNYIQNSTSILNLTAMVNYHELFEIGANYGTDNKYALLTTFMVNDKFVFGYAYEMSTLATLARAKNTNEILLQFKF